MDAQTKQDPQQLLASTLRRLQQDGKHVSPVDALIDQWSEALGEGNLTLENVADELFALRQALAEKRSASIASSLHTLSKLTKQAAHESSDVGLVGQLLQLSDVLEGLSAQAADDK